MKPPARSEKVKVTKDDAPVLWTICENGCYRSWFKSLREARTYFRAVKKNFPKHEFTLTKYLRYDHTPSQKMEKAERDYIEVSVKLYEQPSLYLREQRSKALERLMESRREARRRGK